MTDLTSNDMAPRGSLLLDRSGGQREPRSHSLEKLLSRMLLLWKATLGVFWTAVLLQVNNHAVHGFFISPGAVALHRTWTQQQAPLQSTAPSTGTSTSVLTTTETPTSFRISSNLDSFHNETEPEEEELSMWDSVGPSLQRRGQDAQLQARTSPSFLRRLGLELRASSWFFLYLLHQSVQNARRMVPLMFQRLYPKFLDLVKDESSMDPENVVVPETRYTKYTQQGTALALTGMMTMFHVMGGATRSLQRMGRALVKSYSVSRALEAAVDDPLTKDTSPSSTIADASPPLEIVESSSDAVSMATTDTSEVSSSTSSSSSSSLPIVPMLNSTSLR